MLKTLLATLGGEVEKATIKASRASHFFPLKHYLIARFGDVLV